MNACVILAGGKGSRFNNKQDNLPKQYYRYKGKRILDYTIENFVGEVDNLIVVIRHEDENFFKENYKGINFIIGGIERKDSVYNALQFLKKNFPLTKFVLITDGVRPFTSKNLIQNVIRELEKGEEAVIPAVKINDTIKAVDENGYIIRTVDRAKLWAAQTPQGFNFQSIYRLNKKYKASVFTDDAFYFEAENLKVKVIEGEISNIKITTFEDLKSSFTRNEN
jgi:2-C-methyl-D-erythritol 4-phosphate cytidylyltransferase